MKYTQIIGRSEPVTFVDVDLVDVPAKIDTGAYRSAIHASSIKINVVEGVELLTFKLLSGHKGWDKGVTVTTKDFDITSIENSFGQKESRYVITLRVKIGSKIQKTTFTLADRSKKTYPILIGRRTINKKYLVDSNASNIDRKKLKMLHNVSLALDDEDTKK
jgi:hypothetical protein